MKPDKSSCNRHEHTLYVVEEGSRSRHIRQDNETLAEIGREIRFDQSILDTYAFDGWKTVHHDLLLVCATVEFADHHFARSAKQWSRPFHVTVPVHELEAWQQLKVQGLLRDALRHLTGDDWRFSFVQAKEPAVTGHRQRPLLFDKKKLFAIAYSDGLDSRCVAGILDKDEIAVRVRLSNCKDKKKKREYPFDVIPFQVKFTGSRESGLRSRGFKFAAITAIAADICSISDIVVPESGQGAFGPVILPLHNIYPDYRNYPTFFRKMELFITTLLGCAVTYKQPRLWYTKGQTISAFLAQPGKNTKSVLDTRSCWQQRMNVRGNGEVRQCGLCAACLLRRMSMHAAGVDEPISVYTFSDLTVPDYRDAKQGFNCNWQQDQMVQYGSVGIRHLQQLADLAEQPETALRRYVFEIAHATDASEVETKDNLKRLLLQHAEEWRGFINAQGKNSFLKDWTKGSRYGRSE